MKTISITITQVDNHDESVYFYDSFTMIIMKVMDNLEMFGTKLVSISDTLSTDMDSIKSDIADIIEFYKSSVIIGSVDLSCAGGDLMNEYPDEDTNNKINKIFYDYVDMMKNTGLETLDIDLHDNIEQTVKLFIYPNELGKKIIEYFDKFDGDVTQSLFYGKDYYEVEE